LNNVDILVTKYNINYNDNICGVRYRGNDKVKETQKPPYEEIINKAKDLKNNNPNIKFVVQTDELEFLNSFLNEFPETIFFDEVFPISATSYSNVSFNLKNEDKVNHLINFVSIIYIISKLEHLIITSGNCEIFITLFRNNTRNLQQYLNKNKYIHGELNKEYDENNTQVWY